MRILSVIISILLICVPKVFSQDLETIIDHVQREYEVTDDIQAAFLQIALIKSVPQEKQSRGRVFFKKPGKMRWEYTEPEQQLLVSDGKTMWFYVAEDQQVIIQNAEDAYGSKTPIIFLSGMGKLQNDFYIKLLPASSGENQIVSGHELELLPKQPQSDLAKLIITVDPATYQIIHAAVYDPYGNITNVYLQDVETNTSPPDELFYFDISEYEGIDVIRQNQ
jgi:outer membrane lipoprotein carrier protein